MKLKKYVALTRAGMIESLQFRASFVVVFLGNLVYLTIMYFLWRSIYNSAGTDVVSGMTFSDTLIYLVLATALYNFMEMYLVWQMGRNIQTGQIVLDLLKPMEFRSYMLWSLSGSFVMQFFMTFLPTFIIICLMTESIHFGLNLVLFIISVVMAVIINYNIDFIVGTICLYTQSIWGINIMKQVIVLLLSGATIPIAFFPEPFKTITYYLPFRSIYNSPLTILINDQMASGEIISTLALQLFWCVAAALIGRLFWSISLRKITVNGG